MEISCKSGRTLSPTWRWAVPTIMEWLHSSGILPSYLNLPWRLRLLEFGPLGSLLLSGPATFMLSLSAVDGSSHSPHPLPGSLSVLEQERGKSVQEEGVEVGRAQLSSLGLLTCSMMPNKLDPRMMMMTPSSLFLP